jgi:hypothetical protein
MSKPEPGNYVIYNRVLSPTGEKLALSFNGENQTVTVEPFSDRSNLLASISSLPYPLYSNVFLQWSIVDYSDGRTQSLSPKNRGDLQAAWGSNVVTVLTAGSYVWTIRSSDSGYT